MQGCCGGSREMGGDVSVTPTEDEGDRRVQQ